MNEINRLIIEEKDKIVKGLKKAYEKLVEEKKAKKAKLVILRNGKVVKVEPR
jgi:pyruvate kinase